MKYLILPLLFVFSNSISAQEQVITDDYIEIIFNKETSLQDIVEIQSQMKERNIDLVFNSLVFIEEKLTSISFNVDCNDGYEGSASDSKLTMLPIGFYRNYKEGAASTFGTGYNN